jgi:putative hydrolase of the HAD superfamily
MVKAILFDLYETLVTQSGVDVPRAGALGVTFGLDPTAYRRQWKQLRPQALRGELTFRDSVMECGRRLGTIIPEDRVQQACDDRTRANTIVLHNVDPELITVMRELHARGIRLAAISNCIAEDAAGWPGSALAPHFDCAVFSYVAGVTKPDPRIYHEALRQIGVDSSDAVYIGDGGDDELAGAERAGLRAVQATWFVSREPSPGIPLLYSYADVRRLALE